MTDDLRSGSAAGSTGSSSRTLSGSSDLNQPTDVNQPKVEPSEAVPTTQPSVEISK